MTRPEATSPRLLLDDQLPAAPSGGLVERATPAEDGYEAAELPAEAIREWSTDLRTAELGRVEDEVRRRVPWKVVQREMPREQRSGEPSPDLMTLVAAARAERRKRQVLTKIGLRRRGNPPFDQMAQVYLPMSRLQVRQEAGDWISTQLDRRLGRGDGERKRLATAPLGVQREALAWELAGDMARGELMALAARDVTREELDAVTTEMKQPKQSAERPAANDGQVQVVDERGELVPVSAHFTERGRSPFTVEQWCALPTRPVVTPVGRPPADPVGLAEFLFDKVLYSTQVCDRKGQAVGLSVVVRQDYVDKIAYAIRQGMPIVATEYAPLVAMSNPIKRGTQEPGLTEIDMFRRLAEISHAVEQYYEPGMRWLLGNEAPVFQGPHFGLPEEYVRQFHERCRYLMWLVDPDGTRLNLFDQADLLWGTSGRRAEWDAYEQRKLAELREAFYTPGHPEHVATQAYIATYIYPMATCISPYRFEPAQGLSVRQIAETYAALKTMTGSVVRGVGSLDTKAREPVALTAAQEALLGELQGVALDLTFQYRVTMDSRDELSAFAQALPEYAIRYTMVTKRNKLVLYPNSGQGAYFPAHGEAVLVRPRDPRQRTTVTVRPWWQIAGAADRYVPMHVEGREEPLYFEERMD